MKIVNLQISKVVSQTPELEPVYEQYVIKLEERVFFDFIKQVKVMGYVSARTKVVSAIEKIKGEKKTIDCTGYEKALREAFIANQVEEKVDYKAEFEGQKKLNEELLKRLEALENKEPNEKEVRAGLFAAAREKGLTPPKNISTEDLKQMVENQ